MENNIQGLDQLLDKLTKAEKAEMLKKNLEQACLLVERSAKQKAPKVEGNLRRSIESRIEEEGTSLVGIVFTPLEYAPYVEYGTGIFAENRGGRQDVPWNYQDDEGNWHSTNGIEPSPFLRPALFENKDKIKELLGEGIFGDR